MYTVLCDLTFLRFLLELEQGRRIINWKRTGQCF